MHPRYPNHCVRLPLTYESKRTREGRKNGQTGTIHGSLAFRPIVCNPCPLADRMIADAPARIPDQRSTRQNHCKPTARGYSPVVSPRRAPNQKSPGTPPAPLPSPPPPPPPPPVLESAQEKSTSKLLSRSTHRYSTAARPARTTTKKKQASINTIFCARAP